MSKDYGLPRSFRLDPEVLELLAETRKQLGFASQSETLAYLIRLFAAATQKDNVSTVDSLVRQLVESARAQVQVQTDELLAALLRDEVRRRSQ